MTSDRYSGDEGLLSAGVNTAGVEGPNLIITMVTTTILNPMKKK